MPLACHRPNSEVCLLRRDSHFPTISRWPRDCVTCHMTYTDLFRSLPTISDDFCFQLTSSTHCDPQFSTAQHPHNSVHNCRGHQHEAMSANCFSTTLVQWFRDIMMVTWAHNRCYGLDMVILKVGLLCEPLVLCTSSKIYQLSSFHFKFSHYIYTPQYIPENK
jgi:hypothetical protein